MTTNEIEEIVKEFKRKYICDDDWDNQLYRKEPVGWKNVNKEVESFLRQSLLAYGEKEYLRGREDHIQEENCNCQCSACSDCGATYP